MTAYTAKNTLSKAHIDVIDKAPATLKNVQKTKCITA